MASRHKPMKPQAWWGIVKKGEEPIPFVTYTQRSRASDMYGGLPSYRIIKLRVTEVRPKKRRSK